MISFVQKSIFVCDKICDKHPIDRQLFAVSRVHERTSFIGSVMLLLTYFLVHNSMYCSLCDYVQLTTYVHQLQQPLPWKQRHLTHQSASDRKHQTIRNTRYLRVCFTHHDIVPELPIHNWLTTLMSTGDVAGWHQTYVYYFVYVTLCAPYSGSGGHQETEEFKHFTWHTKQPSIKDVKRFEIHASFRYDYEQMRQVVAISRPASSSFSSDGQKLTKKLITNSLINLF